MNKESGAVAFVYGILLILIVGLLLPFTIYAIFDNVDAVLKNVDLGVKSFTEGYLSYLILSLVLFLVFTNYSNKK